MKYILIISLICFCHLSFSKEILTTIIGKNLLDNHSLENFKKNYGKEKKITSELYLFNKDKTKIEVYLKQDKVYKVIYNYYQSKFSLKEFEKELESFTLIKQKGHAANRHIIFRKDSIQIIFNNNSKKTLKALEVIW